MNQSLMNFFAPYFSAVISDIKNEMALAFKIELKAKANLFC